MMDRMNLLEEFQRHNREEREAYINEAIEEAIYDYAIRVAKVLKAENIKEDKAKKILSEGFDIKPSQASEILEQLQ